MKRSKDIIFAGLVLTSAIYKENDYIWDYHEFKRYINRKNIKEDIK
ncbi:MAG: WxcM-like domain-containing protein [Candidatus Aminicenantes bacterium]|nr:MAG: WxcM-like domain-containing protein [Candidatus Aminicenantes bacterium]